MSLKSYPLPHSQNENSHGFPSCLVSATNQCGSLHSKYTTSICFQSLVLWYHGNVNKPMVKECNMLPWQHEYGPILPDHLVSSIVVILQVFPSVDASL